MTPSNLSQRVEIDLAFLAQVAAYPHPIVPFNRSSVAPLQATLEAVRDCLKFLLGTPPETTLPSSPEKGSDIPVHPDSVPDPGLEFSRILDIIRKNATEAEASMKKNAEEATTRMAKATEELTANMRELFRGYGGVPTTPATPADVPASPGPAIPG